MPASKTSRHLQRGLSFVEQMLTTTVAALLLLLAIPGLDAAKDRHRLQGLAGELESELQWARSEAVSRGAMVRVAFANHASGSCHVVHTGPARACTCRMDGSTSCEAPGRALRSAVHPTAGGVTVQSSAAHLGFDGDLATVTPTATLRLQSQGGQRLNLVINIVGRIRSCMPAAGSATASC
jgi:type IV fimbrial biogenesis protein FimT